MNSNGFFKSIGIILLTFWSFPLSAQVVIHSHELEEISLNEELYIIDEDTDALPTSGWSRYDTDNLLQNHSSFWVKIDLQSNLKTSREYVLYLHDLQNASVFIADKSSNFSLLDKMGVLLPLQERSLAHGVIINGIGNSVQVPLQIKPGSSSIYLHISNKIESIFYPQLKLYTPEYWESTIIPSRQRHLFIQGAIGGAMILISLYHLLIFFWRKDWPFLLYALYTTSAAIVLWHETGITQILFFPDHQLVQRILQLTQVLGGVTTMLYFLFQRSFINLKSVLPRVDKFVIYVLIGIFFYNLILITVFSQQLTLYVHSFSYLTTLTTMVVGLWTLILIFRTGSVLARIFTLGSAALFAGVFCNTIIALAVHKGWIAPLPFPGIYLSEAGILVEVIIFAFGLGYRYNLLQEEKQRIENLDHLKSKFFANISHEFRTPLTIISGITEQIKGHTKEKELIQRNSNNLLNLVNQLLDLSILDAKAMPTKMIQADIIPYLKYLTESFYSMANDKGIRLMFYPEIASQIMDFDEDKVQQIIYNLLTNAIKFTQEKGKIVLHVNTIEEKNLPFLQIKIQDTGKGMKQSEVAHIFDRFYQTQPSLSQQQIGAGIGLALTKELVDLLNGTITVESELNTGSTFTLNLPITQAAVLAYPTLQETSIEISTADPQEVVPNSEGQLVLLVEDNPDIVTYLRGLLSPNFQVLVANNGQEGIEKAKDAVPDIIISDVMMPEMDGNQMCKQLKTDDATSHIPIILLTAKSTQDDKIIGLSQGADVYLTKPFHKKELLLQIDNLLISRQKLQTHYSSFVTQVTKKRSKKEIDPVFDKILKLIESRLDDSTLTVNEISAKIRMSRTQINRKMNALTGVSTSAFITNMRMEKAKVLLEDRTLNISEIAYMVGYNDPNYFTRAFTKHFGYPPSTLRS